MEILGMVLFQLCFIVAGVAFLVFIASKAPKPVPRLASVGETERSLGFKNILNKIPGMSEADREIAANTGTFYTTAPIGNVWERLIELVSRNPIHPNPKFQWRGVRADDAYHRLMMEAGWSDAHKYYGAPGASDFSTQYSCQLTCTVRLEDLAGGGTALHFQHDLFNGTLHGFDMMAEKIKRATNERLRHMCLQMTQDPNRGMPY